MVNGIKGEAGGFRVGVVGLGLERCAVASKWDLEHCSYKSFEV